MVLPGIQALFGFQLIAVFNTGFKANLSPTEQLIHLIALLCITTAAALVMAPAAYHREAKHQISQHFVDLSSRFVAWGMYPLAVGISLDIFLVTRVVLNSTLWCWIITLAVATAFTWIWFIFPKLRAHRINRLPVHPLPEQL